MKCSLSYWRSAYLHSLVLHIALLHTCGAVTKTADRLSSAAIVSAQTYQKSPTFILFLPRDWTEQSRAANSCHKITFWPSRCRFGTLHESHSLTFSFIDALAWQFLSIVRNGKAAWTQRPKLWNTCNSCYRVCVVPLRLMSDEIALTVNITNLLRTCNYEELIPREKLRNGAKVLYFPFFFFLIATAVKHCSCRLLGHTCPIWQMIENALREKIGNEKKKRRKEKKKNAIPHLFT